MFNARDQTNQILIFLLLFFLQKHIQLGSLPIFVLVFPFPDKSLFYTPSSCKVQLFSHLSLSNSLLCLSCRILLMLTCVCVSTISQEKKNEIERTEIQNQIYVTVGKRLIENRSFVFFSVLLFFSMKIEK